jgi:hypothetical protein
VFDNLQLNPVFFRFLSSVVAGVALIRERHLNALSAGRPAPRSPTRRPASALAHWPVWVTNANRCPRVSTAICPWSHASSCDRRSRHVVRFPASTATSAHRSPRPSGSDHAPEACAPS